MTQVTSTDSTDTPQPSGEELKALATHYKRADKNEIYGTGFHVAGTKYVTIKAVDRSLYGKQARHLGGLVLFKAMG